MEEMTLEELDKRVVEEISKKRNLTENAEEKSSKQMKEKMYSSPSVYNDVLDLRNCNERGKDFLIFLHNTKVLIGTINYRGYHCSDYSGDVECFIIPEFRGNGYAYEALKLLSEKLYEDKILDFWISTHKDNLASKKTIEKYGGKQIVPTTHSDKNVLLFECKTSPREVSEIKTDLSESIRNNPDVER